MDKCCPICGGKLYDDGDFLQCKHDTHHRIHHEKEWEQYVSGVKDLAWLRWRCKVRLGKMLQYERRNAHGS